MSLEGLDNYKVADIKKNFNTRFLGTFKFNYWIELGHKGNISLVIFVGGICKFHATPLMLCNTVEKQELNLKMDAVFNFL